jgi:Secretion system C-terminal sorting domain
MKLTKTLFRGILATLVLLVAFCATLTAQQAQDSCFYRLRVYDRFGDGWDGSQVYIRTGNTAELSFTHNGTVINAADSVRFFNIRVKTGDSIFVRYEAQGSFQSEIAYSLFNNADELVFQEGLGPAQGIAFRGLIKCKNCGIPINFVVNEVRTTNATARWSDSRGLRPTYHLQWDTLGFRPGTARNRFSTTDTFAILTNLQELKNYQAYIQTVCRTGDSSSLVGPVAFFTDTATDVSVSRIVSPSFGRCDLNIDTIKFLLSNAGGLPQQLIKFSGSVNGRNLPITFPADGLFTGVLSRDSSALVAVKSLYDFSAPGKYVIKIWSEVSGDRNPKNDTATLTIVRPRLISQLPYFQNFENSEDTWSVYDTVGTSSWEYGTPNGLAFKGAFSGTKAWTTWKDSTYRSNEYGYLLSPCFDFTSLTADPRMSFRIAANSEATYDGTFLEMSTDNGTTWSPVGGLGTNRGLNWYNDSLTMHASRRASWGSTQDSVKNYLLAQNILRGAAGKRNVRLRVGFVSDNSLFFDGVAIDDISIMPVAAADLALQSAVSVSSSVCGSDVANRITVRVSNTGTATQSSYTLNYQVGTQAVVTETSTVAIAANQTVTYRFNTPFNTTTAGNFPVKVWVGLASDAFRPNDTISSNVRITIERPILVSAFPYVQNFENGTGTWSPADSLNGTWGLGAPNHPIINTAPSGNRIYQLGATNANGTYNNNEWSYLLSPCFNFSSFTTDPRISMAINTLLQTGSDGVWLEGSRDGGVTWSRVGTRGTGVNWYSDSINAIQRGVWGGIANVGWRNAQHPLTGFAGVTNARFRFVFRSDASGNLLSVNGSPAPYRFAVDNIQIGANVTSDLATAVNGRVNTSLCGRTQDTVAMLITNLGTQPQTSFVASYRIDNQTVVNENVTLPTALAPTASTIYFFTTLYNSAVAGSHTIRTWVRQPNDTTFVNDTSTTTYFIPSAIANFVSYNFQDLRYPQYWVNNGFQPTLVAGAHGNPVNNGAAFTNIWSSNTSASLTTHRFGPVRSTKDSVSFDHRFVNESAPNAAYPMNNNDTLFFEVATDCNEDWVVLGRVNASNHVQSTNYATLKYALSAYLGRNVRFRWRIKSTISATFGYYYDLDNVNFLTCPESFALRASVRNTRAGQSIGSIALTPTLGLAPFIYNWSNGRTTDSIGGLAAGTYNVTITDARGCTQTTTYRVENTVGFNDPIGLFNKVVLMPNPTSGMVTLDVEFARPVDARIQVLNIVGQPLAEVRAQGISQQQIPLDLSDKPAGVYLVRIIAENRSYVARVIKQ